MASLNQIAQSWLNYVQGSASVKQMMDARLRICDDCPSKRVLNPLGQLVVTIIDPQGSVYYCNQCKCPLAGKTAHPDAVCPLGKWDRWTFPETYY